MFDIVKCGNHEKLINHGPFKDFKFLVLRDCYLTFELLCDLEKLEQKISEFKVML